MNCLMPLLGQTVIVAPLAASWGPANATVPAGCWLAHGKAFAASSCATLNPAATSVSWASFNGRPTTGGTCSPKLARHWDWATTSAACRSNVGAKVSSQTCEA